MYRDEQLKSPKYICFTLYDLSSTDSANICARIITTAGIKNAIPRFALLRNMHPNAIMKATEVIQCLNVEYSKFCSNDMFNLFTENKHNLSIIFWWVD